MSHPDAYFLWQLRLSRYIETLHSCQYNQNVPEAWQSRISRYSNRSKIKINTLRVPI